MAIPKTYRGFTTRNAERTRRWSIYDVELVKVDLMNHFETRIGERVLRPEFGCRIWDYLMEPLTAAMRELVISEAVRICRSDPRVFVHTVDVIDFEHGLRVEITLDYIGLAVYQNFRVDFEARQA